MWNPTGMQTEIAMLAFCSLRVPLRSLFAQLGLTLAPPVGREVASERTKRMICITRC